MIFVYLEVVEPLSGAYFHGLTFTLVFLLAHVCEILLKNVKIL